MMTHPILVTGAAGRVGGAVVEALRRRGLPVKAEAALVPPRGRAVGSLEGGRRRGRRL